MQKDNKTQQQKVVKQNKKCSLPVDSTALKAEVLTVL